MPRNRAVVMRAADLILTYNWGSIAVMAHTPFAGQWTCRQRFYPVKMDLNIHRRPFSSELFGVSPGRASGLSVPPVPKSGTGRLGSSRRPGEACSRYSGPRSYQETASDAFRQHRGRKKLGRHLAGLQPANLPRLVRAFAGLPEEYRHLVPVGEAPEEDAIRRKRHRLDIQYHRNLPGFSRTGKNMSDCSDGHFACHLAVNVISHRGGWLRAFRSPAKYL
jgi:hypothetical protein